MSWPTRKATSSASCHRATCEDHVTSKFDRYVATLVAVWEAFAAAGGGEVTQEPGYVFARHPHPIFNNALLLQPDAAALVSIMARFQTAGEWAVWTCAHETASVAAAAGLQRDVTTTPMMADLELSVPQTDATIEPSIGDDPAIIAELNGLPASLVAGVEGLRATVVGGGTSGLLSFPPDDDLNISFVATRPDASGQGLASAAVVAAMVGARYEGLRTATLPATPMGLGLYQRLGFVPIGEWQEWTPTE